MKNLKKVMKNKKGFTLIELIVVLVILAILAALLIPSLTGYIDKAREKAGIAEARSAMTAWQAAASLWYGESNANKFTNGEDMVTVATYASIRTAAAGLDSTASNATSAIVDGTGKITTFKYTYGSQVVTYTGGVWSVGAT